MRFVLMITIVALSLTSSNTVSRQTLDIIDSVPMETDLLQELNNTIRRLSEYSNGMKEMVEQMTNCANNFTLNLYKAALRTRRINYAVAGYPIFNMMSLMAWAAKGTTKKHIRTAMNLPKNKHHYFEAFQVIRHRVEKYRGNWDWNGTVMMDNDLAVTNIYRNISGMIYGEQLLSSLDVPAGKMDFRSNVTVHCQMSIQRKSNPTTFYNYDYKRVNCTDHVRVTGEYRYGQLPELQVTFFEIPCKQYESKTGEFLRMFILLPNRVNGLGELERNIGKMNLTNLSNGAFRNLNITLPLMQQRSIGNINDELISMGFADVFSEHANFDNMARRVKIRRFETSDDFRIHPLTFDEPNVPSTVVNDVDKVQELIVTCPFISVHITNDENPLILRIARTVSLDEIELLEKSL